MHVPERPQVTQQTAPFVHRQRSPDRAALHAQLRDHVLPGPSERRGLGDGGTHPTQQRQGGGADRVGKVPPGLDRQPGARTRQQAAPRDRHDRTAMAPQTQAGDHVAAGQTGADHQHRSVGGDPCQSVRPPRIGHQARIAGEPGQHAGQVRRGMADRQHQQRRIDRRPAAERDLPAPAGPRHGDRRGAQMLHLHRRRGDLGAQALVDIGAECDPPRMQGSVGAARAGIARERTGRREPVEEMLRPVGEQRHPSGRDIHPMRRILGPVGQARPEPGGGFHHRDAAAKPAMVAQQMRQKRGAGQAGADQDQIGLGHGLSRTLTRRRSPRPARRQQARRCGPRGHHEG